MVKHRILFIDDDPDIIDVLKVAFEDDFEVVTARDGLDGLKKVQACEPDMVVLDLRMPVMDGSQLHEALRHSKQNKNVKVVYVTGFGNAQVEMEALMQGADLFVRKPFNVIDLKKQFSDLLQNTVPREKTLSLEDIQDMGIS